ncbi:MULTISPECIES: response regulator [unclassified Duganella]|uniref:response regulator n=1 Tax=unclassified Duganella TaxID=2636909 RepID=UPI0008FC6466|nr:MULTISPECIES: response regulator [unclassified Duganella]
MIKIGLKPIRLSEHTHLTRLFRPSGIRVLTAPNGASAIDIVSHNDVGVVLSDYNMPGMTGLELASCIRKIKPDTRRLLLSGHADVAAVSAAIVNGTIEQFIDKPWDCEALRATVIQAFVLFEQRASD